MFKYKEFLSYIQQNKKTKEFYYTARIKASSCPSVSEDYSQTWVRDHLWTTATCQQWPAWIPNPAKLARKFCANLWPATTFLTTATFLGSQGWSLYSSLTVYCNFFHFSSKHLFVLSNHQTCMKTINFAAPKK
jgi:hypothetical protein